MGRLIFSMICSLDGYIEDVDGRIDWGAPGEEVSQFVNDLERQVGTNLYGRRLYETMVYWETHEITPDTSPAEREFTELWRAADKVVYSTTLESASSERTRIERRFDPGAIMEMKANDERDITIGGPALAAHAFEAGIVDECQLYVMPLVLGGGKPALPPARIGLELRSERRFDSGAVFLHYAVR